MYKFLLVSLSIIILVLIIPVAAQEELPEFIQHSECQVDLSGESFTPMFVGDLSGVYSPITRPLVAGIEDAVTYFNRFGGICGATINLPDLSMVDTGGNQEQTAVIYERLKDDVEMLILYSSDDAELLRNNLAEDEIAVIIAAGSINGLYGDEQDGHDSPGWSFATNPLYVDQMGSFCAWASENLDDPVLGYLSWPSAFGLAAFTPESVMYCESVGVGMIRTPEYFVPGGEIQGQVRNLLDAGATIIYTNTLGSGPVQIASTLVAMGERENVTLAGVNWTLDTSVGYLREINLSF